jgi:hypothetical protein
MDMHSVIYGLTALHLLVGLTVGIAYLRMLIEMRHDPKIPPHAKHVVPVAFGWSMVVFVLGYRSSKVEETAWDTWLLAVGLILMAYAVTVLVKEGSLSRRHYIRRKMKREKE